MRQDGQESPVGDVALVLEGGGMRGVYTTGVLDGLLDNGIFFKYVIGVSAGASHALSYLSRQRDRARRVNVDYCRRGDYMGLGCLLREGSLFGMDLLFNKIPFELDPYDFAEFERNSGSYYAVATSLRSGTARYFAPRSADSVLNVAKASCSLPFVSPPVVIDGEPFLDGGIGDSIPVRKPLDDGFKKLVVVLTQPRGYRKGPTTNKWLYRAWYGDYPEFARALERRNESYNETLEYIDRLEADGSAFVIRPAPQPGLKRLERNPERLNALHRSGYSDIAAALPSLKDFIA